MDVTFIVSKSNSKMQKYQCKNVVASGHTAVNMSRQCLLKWINDTLGLEIKKVEALCSGAVYLQFINILFPGCIQLKRIKFEASVMNEYWSNFKQLQIAFREIGCEKDVPINKLIEGRFQENFEFLQWFKRFYDANIDEPFVTNEKTKAEQAASQPSSSKRNARSDAIVNPVTNGSQRVKEIKSQIAEYEEKARKVSQEKKFYFHKLRKIEMLCSEEEAFKTAKKDFVEKILNELYASAEETTLSEDEE